MDLPIPSSDAAETIARIDVVHFDHQRNEERVPLPHRIQYDGADGFFSHESHVR